MSWASNPWKRLRSSVPFEVLTPLLAVPEAEFFVPHFVKRKPSTKGASKLTGAGFFDEYAHHRYTAINGPMFKADRVFENYHGASSLLKPNKEA